MNEKAAAWKKFEGGMTREKSKNKVVVSVQEVKNFIAFLTHNYRS